MADKKVLQVEIITPVNVVFSGEAESVTVPGGMGAFQVLYNHAPIVSTLEPGLVSLNFSAGEKKYKVTAGFAEVLKNHVSIVVENAEEIK